MNEENTQPNQPVSVHDAPERGHGALPFITAMLGIFLVLAILALGYVIVTYVRAEPNNVNEVPAQGSVNTPADGANEQTELSFPPFLYTDNGWDEDDKAYSFLKQVDRETGEEKTVLESSRNLNFITLIAVPQIGYDGKVYVHQGCVECDNPYLELFELSLNGTKLRQINLADGFVFRSAAAVSPDQTRMAVAQYDDLDTGHSGDVIVYNFLTGEKEVVGSLAADEYFSQYFGSDAFAGAGGFTVAWKNRECFNVTIYEDSATPREFNAKDYKEMRTFCSEPEIE